MALPPKRRSREVEAQFGPIAVLVNNAGIVRDGLAMRMSSEDFRAVLDVNLTGAFHMIRACLPLFIRRRAGSIVNITSVSGMKGNPGQANYASSKAGLIGLTKTIAREVASRGNHRQRRGPGFHSDRHDRRHERGRPAKRALPPCPWAASQAGGRGKRRLLPRKRRRFLHHGCVLKVDGGMYI